MSVGVKNAAMYLQQLGISPAEVVRRFFGLMGCSHAVHPDVPRYVFFTMKLLNGDRMAGVFDVDRFYVYLMTPFVFDISVLSLGSSSAILVVDSLLSLMFRVSQPLVLLREGSGAGRLAFAYDLLKELLSTSSGSIEESLNRFRAALFRGYSSGLMEIETELMRWKRERGQE